MYCTKCGKSNDADAKFCTSCGSPLVRKTAQENRKPAGDPEKSSVLGIIALVCAFLFPIVGLILGLIDYNTKDGYSKNIAKWAMIAAGVILVLRVVLSIVSAIMGAAISRVVMELIADFLKMYM